MNDNAPAQSGIHPVLYTFFNADGSIDHGAVAAQVDFTLARGAHGLVTLGIASEVLKLDVEERRAVMATVARAVGGRVPLGVTVAEPSVAGQVDFARRAADQGADWVVLQSPQIKVPEAELVAFTEAVASSVELPCAVQSNPGNMDVALSNASLLELRRRCETIRLLKAEGTVASSTDLVGRGMAVFGGRNGLELPTALAAGFAGNIPAPEFAAELVAVFEAARGPGGLEEARRLHQRILPAIVFVNHALPFQLCYGKRALARRMGIAEVHDRGPSLRPTAFGLAELEALLAAAEP